MVGRHPFPDVVLEKDLTTDVRRGKLRLYEAWGLPEVWVEVPDRRTPCRPRGRRPGLAIHVLEAGGYRESPVSLAFPDWREAAIREAMNEVEPSTWGRTRGWSAWEGCWGSAAARGPDEDPLLRSLRDESRVEGRVEGWESGRAEGQAGGRTEGRREMVRQIRLSRGAPVSAGLPGSAPPALAESREEVLVAAALACGSERDFHAHVARGEATGRV